VRLIDLNLLLYAVNRDTVHHRRAKAWLERALSGERSVALPWVVVLGFLRVTTHPRVFARPLAPEAALSVVDGWLGRPNVVGLQAGDEHWRVLRSLLDQAGTAGNLTTDAHLAALAIEHDCELCSTDTDFARFPDLRWVNPLQG
jgi:uncharacterized protein